jgi:hypothetical protein
MKTDPKEYALKALEVAKQDLRRDKYLLPVAFIITDSEILDFNINFGDADQRALVYARLVEIAKQKGGRAIVTLNDATVTDWTSAEKAKQDSIYVTASGPDMQTWSVSLPYTKVGDEIIFGQLSETTNDFLNLLRSWPTKLPIES